MNGLREEERSRAPLIRAFLTGKKCPDNKHDNLEVQKLICLLRCPLFLTKRDAYQRCGLGFFFKSLLKSFEAGDGGDEGGWYGHHKAPNLLHTGGEFNLHVEKSSTRINYDKVVHMTQCMSLKLGCAAHCEQVDVI